MKYFEDIYRNTDVSKMTLPECILLEMHKIMKEYRLEMNRDRLVRQNPFGFANYLRGKMDGLWYGMSTPLIWNYTSEFYELKDIYTAFVNEMSFLSGEYQNG